MIKHPVDNQSKSYLVRLDKDKSDNQLFKQGLYFKYRIASPLSTLNRKKSQSGNSFSKSPNAIDIQNENNQYVFTDLDKKWNFDKSFDQKEKLLKQLQNQKLIQSQQNKAAEIYEEDQNILKDLDNFDESLNIKLMSIKKETVKDKYSIKISYKKRKQQL